MKKFTLLFVMLLNLVLGHAKNKNIEFTEIDNTISLNGEWTMKSFEFGMGTWKPAWGIFMAFPPPNADSLMNKSLVAQVPGSVQYNLVQLGEVKDPYIGDNVKDIRWVENKEWWFVKQVDVPAIWTNKQITLDCNMINYQADVWVNETWCGRTVGNYQEMNINVGNHLKAGQKNDIIVRLRAPENSVKAIQNNLFFDWTTEVDGDLHERPWVTPSNPQAGEYLISKCVFGWDWGPHIVPIGILQPIQLVAKSDVQLENVFIKTVSIDKKKKKAELNIDFTLKNNAEEELIIEYALIEKESNQTAYNHRFESTQAKESVNLTVNDAKLWWPNNYGKANLYRFEAQVKNKEGKVLDRLTEQFGIRTLEKVRNEDKEWTKEKVVQFSHGIDESLEDGEYDWTFLVNGEKIFVQGMNSIPMDAMFNLDEEIYRYTLRCAQEANVNMLRVWGEGLYETDTFYDLCDSLGIMVWQDFWVGSYSPAQDQTASWKAVESNIKRTRNHPSLVLYCGGNEFNATRVDRLVQINELDRLIKKYDGTREFHKASPHGGNVHGGMGIVKNEDRSQKYARFCSEAGYQQSWPPLSDMKKFLNEEQMFPLKDNSYWLSVHNSSVASYPEWQNAVYGVPETLEEVIHTEMMHNIIGWQAQMENTRLERFKVSGCLFWALNDVWPTTSWSMIDWYGTCKNHYYAFKKAASPIQVTASQQHQILLPGEAYDIEVSVINDRLQAQKELRVEAVIYMGEKAKKVYAKTFQGDVNANGVAKLGQLDWTVPTENKEHNLILVLELYNKNNDLIANNAYTCMIGEEKDEERVSVSGGFFGEYRAWKKNNIEAQVKNFPTQLKQGEEKAFTIVYKNNSKNVVMGLESLITDLPKGIRLYLHDNYVHLLPGQEIELNASIQNTFRSGKVDQITLTFQTDGWNVKRNTQNFVIKTI